MYAQFEKPKEIKSRTVTNTVTQEKSKDRRDFGFVWKRPFLMVQRKDIPTIQLEGKDKKDQDDKSEFKFKDLNGAGDVWESCSKFPSMDFRMWSTVCVQTTYEAFKSKWQEKVPQWREMETEDGGARAIVAYYPEETKLSWLSASKPKSGAFTVMTYLQKQGKPIVWDSLDEASNSYYKNWAKKFNIPLLNAETNKPFEQDQIGGSSFQLRLLNKEWVMLQDWDRWANIPKEN